MFEWEKIPNSQTQDPDQWKKTLEQLQEKWKKTLGKLQGNQFMLIVKARHWYCHNLSEGLDKGSVLNAMEKVCTELAKVQQPVTPWHSPPLAETDTETGTFCVHYSLFVA